MNSFDRTDISGEIDVNKATKSKECGVFHYRFLDEVSKFQNLCLQYLLWFIYYTPKSQWCCYFKLKQCQLSLYY